MSQEQTNKPDDAEIEEMLATLNRAGERFSNLKRRVDLLNAAAMKTIANTAETKARTEQESAPAGAISGTPGL